MNYFLENKMYNPFNPVACNGRKTSHGWKVFTCIGKGRMCPIVPLPMLKQCMLDELYKQYFCDYPVCQTKEKFHRKKTGAIEFYCHCHCDRPGTLQCLAAKQVLINSFAKAVVHLFTDELIVTVPVCCNTFLCCPIEFLGAYKIENNHGFILMCSKLESFTRQWFSYMSITVFDLNSIMQLVVLSCSCTNSHYECCNLMEKRFNFVRMSYSCSLLSRTDFWNPKRESKTRKRKR